MSAHIYEERVEIRVEIWKEMEVRKVVVEPESSLNRALIAP